MLKIEISEGNLNGLWLIHKDSPAVAPQDVVGEWVEGRLNGAQRSAQLVPMN
jgi:hypothetical protein